MSSRQLRILGSLVAVLVASGMLTLSLWREAEKRAYERVVPTSLQGELDEDEGQKVMEGSGVIIPGDWGYYPMVAMEKLGIWVETDRWERLAKLVRVGSQRVVMARELASRGEMDMAIKTMNKGVSYLETAVRLLDIDGWDPREAEAGWRLVGELAQKQLNWLVETKSHMQNVTQGGVDELIRQLTQVVKDAEVKGKE